MSTRIQTPPNLIAQPVVEFRKNDYEAAIWNKGYDIILESAVRCPCKSENNDNIPHCQNCLGTGWFFINPIKTKAILTGINKNTDYKDWSAEMIGTISVTTMDINKLSFMDRITLVNSIAGLVQNRSIFTETKRLRTFGENPKFVFLSYEPKEILDVWIYRGSGYSLVKLDPSTDYNIKSDNGYVLEFTYDFNTVSNFNGTISIRYEHELQYHILDLPHDVRNSSIKSNLGSLKQQLLPVNAIARKAHYVLNRDNYDANFIINNSYL